MITNVRITVVTMDNVRNQYLEVRNVLVRVIIFENVILHLSVILTTTLLVNFWKTSKTNANTIILVSTTTVTQKQKLVNIDNSSMITVKQIVHDMNFMSFKLLWNRDENMSINTKIFFLVVVCHSDTFVNRILRCFQKERTSNWCCYTNRWCTTHTWRLKWA